MIKNNTILISFIAATILFSSFAPPSEASEGFSVTGQSGVMHFVAVEPSQKDNEDVYRLAVGTVCAGRAICQVHFWVDSAPSGFPLTDSQMASKVAHWQQNLNTGLRHWFVNCSSSGLFANERKCM